MTKPFDPSADSLASASLSPEQRQAWEATLQALAEARAKAQELETRIKDLERQSPDEQNAILTRAEFNREVARMLAHDERYGGSSSVVYLDFENMDDVTARFGKAVANATIREISNVLMKNVRGSDVIGRLAPDEFGILLVRCDNTNAWRKGKELVGFLTEALSEIQTNKLDIVISYGAYTFSDSEDVTTGLKHAAAMLKRGT